VTFRKEEQNKDSTTSKILPAIHVDDAIVVATNNIDIYQRFLQELGSELELSASGKLTWFLGCNVEQNLEKGTVRLTQERYCKDVLT
jgi:hypothetical protein